MMGASHQEFDGLVFADDVDGRHVPSESDIDKSPQWVWVLVRATLEPPQRVWVRFQAECYPEGLWTVSAAAPKPQSAGIRMFPGPPRPAARNSVQPFLAPFIAQIREVARERRAVLVRLRDALLKEDNQEALKFAHDLVGLPE